MAAHSPPPPPPPRQPYGSLVTHPLSLLPTPLLLVGVPRQAEGSDCLLGLGAAVWLTQNTA